jgi:hypothetical protein
MIASGIETAQKYGLTLQSSFGAFVSLQCGTSPDFHRHPLIHGILLRPIPEKTIIQCLFDEVPKSVWESIREGADGAAWFLPARESMQLVRVAAGTCRALSNLAQSQPDEAVLHAFFGAAITRAGKHGIDWDDGLIVFAAAIVLYGEELGKASGPDWARGLFSPPPLSAPKIVSLLRLRIALDTNILV